MLQPRLTFLQSKIMDLQQALFFADTEAVLKFPICIINVLEVDAVGQVWFMVHRPPQLINEFDKEFRAKLDFYKKGKNYYMHVSGKACIVTDPEEINHSHVLDADMKRLATTSMVLIRMKVTEIRYFPAHRQVIRYRMAMPTLSQHPSTFVKSLQYIIKDIIPVFQSH